MGIAALHPSYGSYSIFKQPRYTSAFSRLDMPELCITFALLENRGRREDRVRAAPAISRAICTQQKRTRAYRFGGNTPAFPAQWLYGLLRALPGERLFCHRRDARMTLAQLDASTAASGPHDFAVRSSCTRQSQLSRPPHLTARS